MDILLPETPKSSGDVVPTNDAVAITRPQPTAWQRWVERPEKIWMRQLIFQLHLWLRAFLSAYVLFMSLSGSVIVFRNELSPIFSIEWLVRLHEQPLPGDAGHLVNALGAC